VPRCPAGFGLEEWVTPREVSSRKADMRRWEETIELSGHTLRLLHRLISGSKSWPKQSMSIAHAKRVHICEGQYA
jgi:hypothetical protein